MVRVAELDHAGGGGSCSTWKDLLSIRRWASRLAQCSTMSSPTNCARTSLSIITGQRLPTADGARW